MKCGPCPPRTVRRPVTSIVVACLLAVTGCASGGTQTASDRVRSGPAAGSGILPEEPGPPEAEPVASPTSETTTPTTVTPTTVTSTTRTSTTLPTPTILRAPLTTENWERYDYRTAPGTVTVRAADDLASPNIREVFWPTDTEPERDGQICTTWNTAFDLRDRKPAQPGVAMRIATVGPDHRTLRAVTVTENVWQYGIWLFNVHVWDTSQPRPMTLVKTWDLSEILIPERGSDPDPARLFVAPPWHLCGRTTGDVFSFKVWANGQSEPSWSDPERVFHTRLPPGWDHAGYSGGYIGHLRAGRAVSAALDTTG